MQLMSNIYVVLFGYLCCFFIKYYFILMQQLNGRMLVRGTMSNMIRDLISLGLFGNICMMSFSMHIASL